MKTPLRSGLVFCLSLAIFSSVVALHVVAQESISIVSPNTAYQSVDGPNRSTIFRTTLSLNFQQTIHMPTSWGRSAAVTGAVTSIAWRQDEYCVTPVNVLDVSLFTVRLNDTVIYSGPLRVAGDCYSGQPDPQPFVTIVSGFNFPWSPSMGNIQMSIQASNVVNPRGWYDIDAAGSELVLQVQIFIPPEPPCTPHKATAVAQVVNGFVVGASVTDSGCGYTNTPMVVIRGGGGTNATATAVLTNGNVAAINIMNAGCCYTNTPQIIIASPPFVPKVAISFSRVRVTQSVVLGRRYVLEASNDLITWSATGPPFTADSETIESEFDIAMTGRYFRLRETL
ncbi:MAG TPA: hypothetical protein VFT34_13055 [Verrucomicrobiae bacterium]|nr:hypothetical protein [Verrucomicrobiae bacterium]